MSATVGAQGMVLMLGVLGCGGRIPEVQSIKRDLGERGWLSPEQLDDVATVRIVDALAACERDQHAVDHDPVTGSDCRVLKEQIERRHDAIARQAYFEPYFSTDDALGLVWTGSCADASEATANLTAQLGPVETPTGTIPRWDEPSMLRRTHNEQAWAEVLSSHALVHGVALLRCGDGPGLSQALAFVRDDVEPFWRAQGHGPKHPIVQAKTMLELLASSDPPAMARLLEAGTLDPDLAVLLSRAPLASCPSPAQSLALLQSPRPTERALGCACVDDGSADARRLRHRLAHYDVFTQIERQHNAVSQFAEDLPDNVPAVATPGIVATAVVLSLFSIGRGKTTKHHNFEVRRACRWAMPLAERPHEIPAPSLALVGRGHDNRFADVLVLRPGDTDRYVNLGLISVDEHGEPDGRYCGVRRFGDRDVPLCKPAKHKREIEVMPLGAAEVPVDQSSTVRLHKLGLPPEVQHLIVVEIVDEKTTSGDKVKKVTLRSQAQALAELAVRGDPAGSNPGR